ncbi:hypothetical protein IQ06DRAFT_44788 [Phaeosphaeriaceae sp. SRC1lsM3a]|nr:hypothetical protein IQ06DRAFT_44788 [Stagonospora sp. SRC1lsM3a]
MSQDLQLTSDCTEQSTQDAQARRKDQIRRAQKTHRERKEAYTKALETEVVQLRANEAKIIQETKRLYAELTTLKKIMVDHGLQVPDLSQILVSPPATGVEEAFDFNMHISKGKNKQRQIRVWKSPDAQNHGQDAQTNTSYSSPFSESSFRSPASQTSDTTLHPNPNKLIAELDHTIVGMDFVMTLETPCLGHILDAPPDASSGHSLMVSATVLHHQNQPSRSHTHAHSHTHRPRPLAINSHQNQQLAWQMPAVGIERLLELSASVPVPDGELTPVQAWDALRRHPEFGGLEVGRLKRLEERLVGGIKCYGFGGVIDQGTFDDALFETFVVGQVF